MEYENLIGGAITDKISIYNCDCMELLRQTPDNYYSLAICDPPYGLSKSVVNSGGRFKRYSNKNGNWDMNVPTDEYFKELFRVSKTKIIVSQILRKITQGQEERFHPTQKLIYLYQYILDKYAKQGDKILDTHSGSASLAIACHDYGFELTACELDIDYYNQSIKRLKNHISQQKLF